MYLTGPTEHPIGRSLMGTPSSDDVLRFVDPVTYLKVIRRIKTSLVCDTRLGGLVLGRHLSDRSSRRGHIQRFHVKHRVSG